MMRFPIKYRRLDDDHAPLDYQIVGSVEEGNRVRRAELIHRGAERGVLRHRAEPDPRADLYGTRARRSPVASPSIRKEESFVQGEADAGRRIAYPKETFYSQEHDQNALPSRMKMRENQNHVAAPVSRVTRSTHGQDDSFPDSSMTQSTEALFDAPKAPEVPEWLRVAQQNNMNVAGGRVRRQQVTVAPQREAFGDGLGGSSMETVSSLEQSMHGLPQTAWEYEQAGYPAQLLQEQQLWDAKMREQQVPITPRHGAQYAVHARARKERERTTQYVPVPYGQEEGSRGSYPPPRRNDRGREHTVQRWMEEGASVESGLEDGYGRGYESFAQSPWKSPQKDSYSIPLGYTASGKEPHAPYEQQTSVKRSFPVLGITVCALAMVTVVLWLLGMSFAGQVEEILHARSEATDALVNKHPYRYREQIETQAQVQNLHPAFVAAIVLNESSFDARAESRVGARGLMQMMEPTYQWVHDKIGEGASYQFDDMYSPDLNLRYATWYLHFLSDEFMGDPILVAAAFHAGQGEIKNWLSNPLYSDNGRSIVLERMMDGPTKSYVTKVLGAYATYKRIYYEDAGIV